MKNFDSMLVRTLVAAHTQLLKATTQLSNQIRGLMKTFGLVVPKGAGRVFEGHVRSLLANTPGSSRSSCRCSSLGEACAPVPPN